MPVGPREGWEGSGLCHVSAPKTCRLFLDLGRAVVSGGPGPCDAASEAHH